MEMDQMFLNRFLKYIIQLCMESKYIFSLVHSPPELSVQVFSGVFDANNKNLCGLLSG